MNNDLHISSDTIFVVSAPSGAGKTTLNRLLCRDFSTKIEISVSLTTRTMRSGETEGIHYHYVSRGKFESEIHSKNMLEWANVHGNLYGTSLNEIKRIQGLGKYPLLEIDVQGWEQARPQLIDAVSIFILPPSMRQMWERLEQRGTDSFETRWERMQNARSEIAAALHYDYFIANDVLEQAYSQLQSIAIKQSPACLDHDQGLELCQKLMVELDDPEFFQSIREV